MIICAIQTPAQEHWRHLESTIQLHLPRLLNPKVQYIRVEKPELAAGCQVFVVVCPSNGKNVMALASEIEALSGVKHLVIEDAALVNVGQLERVAQRVAEMICSLRTA